MVSIFYSTKLYSTPRLPSLYPIFPEIWNFQTSSIFFSKHVYLFTFLLTAHLPSLTSIITKSSWLMSLFFFSFTLHHLQSSCLQENLNSSFSPLYNTFSQSSSSVTALASGKHHTILPIIIMYTQDPLLSFLFYFYSIYKHQDTL